jgi:hypothetical protein
MSSSSFVNSPDGLNCTGVRMLPPPGRVIAFYSTSVSSARPASSALTADDLIKEFLDRIGTPHNLTLAYSKQENALVERVNKEVNRHLRAFIFESIDLASYRTHLPFVQLSMHQYTLARAPPRPVSCSAIKSCWTRVSYCPLSRSPRPSYQHSFDESRRHDPHPGNTHGSSSHSFA